MAISIGDALLKLGVDTKDFDKSMQGLQGRVQKHSKAIGMAMTAAGGAIVAVGVLSVKKFAEMGDEVQKMSLRTGFSTEALSEWRHAAEISGAELGTLEKGVKRMSTSIIDAQDGLLESVRNFDKLGIAVEDLEGLTPEEQFEKIAMALSELEDPTLKAAIAQKIFGRAGTELLPLLAQGKDGIADLRQEAHDLGIVFDQEAADKAANLSDAMHRMEEATSGLKMKIADVLIPALMPLIDKVTAILKAMQDWAKEHPGLAKTIVIVVSAIGMLLLVLGPLMILLPGIIAAAPLVGAAFTIMLGPVGLIIAAIVALIAIGVLLWKNWDTIKEKSVAIWEGIVSFFKGVWKRITGLFSEHWDKILAILFPMVGIPILIARNWGKIVEVVSDIWNRVTESVSGILGNLKNVIMDFGRNALDWLKKKFEEVIAPIKETWEWIRNLIGRSPGVVMLGKEMEELGDKLPKEKFIIFTREALLPALSAIRMLVEWTENLKNSMLGLRDAASLVAKTFVPELLASFAFVGDALLALIETVNAYIESLLAIPRQVTTRVTTVRGGGVADTGDWGGGDDGGMAHLERGGIAMRPMQATIADKTPEAVIPLDRGTLERLGIGGYRTANIILQVEGRTIVRAIGIPLVDEIRARTGARM